MGDRLDPAPRQVQVRDFPRPKDAERIEPFGRHVDVPASERGAEATK